jgi:Mrp family chromosome partitioning ATPase
MERIKQALERARAQQAARGGEQGPAPAGVEAVRSALNGAAARPATAGAAVPAGAAGSTQAGPATAPASNGVPVHIPLETSFAYTQTQVVQLSREHLRANRVVLGDEKDELSNASNAYKILRTQVLQRMAAQGWNALAVVSPGHGDGATLTATNLAISLSREVHRTVLLVDLNLREPNVHRLLGFEPQYGLSDYIVHDVPLNEILVNPGIDRMVVLPGREPVFNSAEILASPKMVRLVEELKTRYPSRIVVFDLPPLLGTPDALAFSPYADTVLLVLRDAKTSQDDLVKAMTLLDSVNVLGTVLNGTRDPGARYGAR